MEQGKYLIQAKATVDLTYSKELDDFIFRIKAPQAGIHSKRIDGMDRYFEYLEEVGKTYSLVVEYKPTNLNRDTAQSFQTFNYILQNFNEISMYGDDIDKIIESVN